jgi:hypothetical protein
MAEVFIKRLLDLKRAVVDLSQTRGVLMKIRLVLSTKSPKQGKPIELKLNVPPSKSIGFINFVNAALQGDAPVNISFEKIINDQVEQSKVQGEFKFFQAEPAKKAEKK